MGWGGVFSRQQMYRPCLDTRDASDVSFEKLNSYQKRCFCIYLFSHKCNTHCAASMVNVASDISLSLFLPDSSNPITCIRHFFILFLTTATFQSYLVPLTFFAIFFHVRPLFTEYQIGRASCRERV